jgi:hypothetical protein
MEKEQIIYQCFMTCPFFGSVHVMTCDHPYWEGSPVGLNMIITHENSRDGNFPQKCPLRMEDLTIKYRI